MCVWLCILMCVWLCVCISVWLCDCSISTLLNGQRVMLLKVHASGGVWRPGSASYLSRPGPALTNTFSAAPIIAKAETRCCQAINTPQSEKRKLAQCHQAIKRNWSQCSGWIHHVLYERIGSWDQGREDDMCVRYGSATHNTKVPFVLTKSRLASERDSLPGNGWFTWCCFVTLVRESRPSQLINLAEPQVGMRENTSRNVCGWGHQEADRIIDKRNEWGRWE